ncbi:acetyl-CoA carboxylase biotin carboxylase subunit [Sulfuriroseicoccus oceanibius]|uniref:Biotin carboxylase n=1 Tax=Sulfuriroseicoccus oceanibius TaxID=2707525 RepID=A0A6B3LEH9_9BACT|nr:acetyl-CoA carboxylase biotin carboxylase subunit [Sulfuriroseicoccus oceanibius]QQL44959.1 acetyl-CoA carboxylase biotin carboxylase subunit [Sulfuriroseicoccus oceanibius]
MFSKVLVANRGEIALRVIRACRELNIETVAVYSEADVDSMHVQLADEAVCIGSGPSNQSYLKSDRIIAAAEITGADAIHPGYGFLSENARFAEICESCNIKFIGPSAEVIRMMGDKNTARATAFANGVPATPGSDGCVEDAQDGLKVAKEIGFPVMIKATAGGGGRGMRPVFEESEFISQFDAASSEAMACFGNGDCYIEKLVLNPHHIEFQIIADSHGNAVHLGERDCSMQRRNQKIIEEAPSPILGEDLRKRMGEASVNIVKAIGYENAGTIEYLVDNDGNFYFMEMNTRIQVEHPITEEVYGCDLIKEQIRIAAGLELSDHLKSCTPRGHSIECRINAEDAYAGFMPSPGQIELWYAPGGRGVRVDTHVYSGYSVPPYYDSMIAKLIVHGATRESAIARMRRALKEFMIHGIKTTIPFQLSIIDHKDFREGNYDIGWVGEFIKRGEHLELREDHEVS